MGSQRLKAAPKRKPTPKDPDLSFPTFSSQPVAKPEVDVAHLKLQHVEVSPATKKHCLSRLSGDVQKIS